MPQTAPVTRALTTERVLRDIEVVSRAGLDLETFLDEALTSLNRAMPWMSACVATVDPTTLLLTGTLKFGDLRGNDEHDHEFGLIEYGSSEITSFIEVAHRAYPAVAVSHADPGSFRMNEFMRPYYGFSDEMRVVMRDRGQVWGAMALFRGSGEAAFSDDDVDLLASLSEVMSHGIRVGLLSRLGEATHLPPSGPAVVVVGADDQIHQMSAGAEARLADLMISADGTDPAGIVASLIGAARRYARGESAAPPRCRVRSGSGMWLVLHATPMSPRGDVAGDVVVTIDEARPPEIVPLVVAAFDLTERERAVTERVLQGLDTKEIASSLHLSAYTVQDHLKSIFAKADVRSRRELIARIYFDQYVPRMGTEVGPTGWFANA